MADKGLFSRLQRLFSSDVIIRNVGGSELKVADVNQIQTTGKYETNALVDRFNRLYGYNAVNAFNPNINYQTLRAQLYSEYEAMDTDAIIASTLDIIADEATLRDEHDDVLTVHSTDENIKRILNNLFYDVLNIEFNLWSWVRQMCKYGDFFLKLEISEDFGVYNVLPYTVFNMARYEGTDESNPSKVTFVIDPDGLAISSDPTYAPHKSSNVLTLDNYEVAHFRLLSDAAYLPYGRSYLEPARKLFKQYTLMEDAMLIHRVMRAPEKRTFYVNVGGIPPNEVENFMQKTMNTMKKTPYVDPKSGQYNLKFNMQNMMEDFYIPVRGGDATTRIETTPGLQYDGIQDVEYLRDKLFAALKVPKAYMGYEKDLTGKATLAAEDIRFARTIERIQRIIESELSKIALVHLYSQGFTGEDLTNFEIKLTNSSIIYEQEKLALLSEKVNLAGTMKDTKLFSSDYIYNTVFKIGEDEYNEMRSLIREDTKREFVNNQIETEGNDPSESGITYGTPHDLASIYGRRGDNEKDRVPAGYGNDIDKGGRPKEKASFINTQDDPLGFDRLGSHDMKKEYEKENDKLKESYSNQTAKSVFYKNMGMFKKEVKKEPSLLNEDNLDK